MSAPIYLDYQATTPLASEAREAMLPFLEDKFGNPHSPHKMGREAAAAVEVAREQVMGCIGADSGNLYFTSGATEAANWAIKGALANMPESRRRIVTAATEHACVLDTCAFLESWGCELTVLDVSDEGLVDPMAVEAALDDDVALVALMLVNNEIGVTQRIAEIGPLAEKCGALMFCDAVQALGRVAIPWRQCDMIAMSSHKIHGPKGIGALWLADGVKPAPLLHGGGQEGDLRSGTLAPALCAGFGAAAALMAERHDEDYALVEKLWAIAIHRFGDRWTINGSDCARYPGNLNIRLDGLDASRLISDTRGVAFSAGSACASGSGRPSRVLSALGLSKAAANASIRLGFGRYTSEEDLEKAIDLILESAHQQLPNQPVEGDESYPEDDVQLLEDGGE
ncbi:cysteine desulfurase family protein [Parasphingopyxis lamellibrachiae]|uniref:Cysteine desulfurase n=1 Tax=Parasphingopyxis lamellibrachiae TaxID=680125 RepID=A0A3D9FCC3_9SPHN|nr:cysteine desulfurase family protein [Parasphingopyxis lamellibrachiae]RED15435.1 cysteine desulfurase [Parasphingopyxis lamellibrachiae]